MEFHDLMVIQMLNMPIYDISYDRKTIDKDGDCMTGNIILNYEDSARLRYALLHPNIDYSNEEIFNIVINSYGTDSIVQFDDLDLSKLDA